MRVGVISDTHVPATADQLPPVIFEIFRGVDLILHAGDIVELAVLDTLRTIAPVEAVAGNMDSGDVRQTLPEKKTLELGRFRVGLIHGKFPIPEQQQRVLGEFSAVDLIVYGHSHKPFWGQVNGVYLLNPGTPTDYLHTSFNSVAVLEIGTTLEAEIVEIRLR